MATSDIHALLDEAERKFHEELGHIADEVQRFTPHLNTVRMVVDQAADKASKVEE